MRIAVVYGSETGNTETHALAIAKQLGEWGEVTVASIADTDPASLSDYDLVVLGASTWGYGDLPAGWQDKSDLGGVDLTGRKAAVFGTGDQMGFGDTFVDSIGILAASLEASGAQLVGAWPVDGYDHNQSAAQRDGVFVGLPLDDDNQPELSDERIAKWTAQIRSEVS